MFIFLYIGISLILVLLFTISYITIERIRDSKLFFRWQAYGYIKNVLEGLIYSVLIILFKLILKAIDQNLSLPIFIIGVLLLTIVRNIVVGTFAIFAPFVYYLIEQTIDLRLYITLGLMILMLFVIEIVQFFTKDFWFNFTIINLWMIIAFFIVLAYDFIFSSYITKRSMEIMFLPYFGLMIVYIFLEIAIKFLISANILSKSVKFNFSRYYRQSLREVAINDFVSEHKLTKGVYGIFEFNYQQPRAIERNLEIKESILIDLEKIFPQKGVLFRADESRYGFFLPLDEDINLKQMLSGNNQDLRLDYDVLKKIENLLRARSINYITSWKEKVLIQIRSGVALYGLHDYSIFNLHKFADFALKNEQSNQKNCLQLFNPHDYFMILREKKLLNEMDQAIKLDNFVNNFTPIFDYKKKQTVFNFITAEKIAYAEIKEPLRDFVNFFEWTNIFDRYMAFWALSKGDNKNKKVAFFYSPQILEQGFEFTIFKNKLNKLNVTCSELIFIFDPYMFSRIKNKNTFYNNLKILVNDGLQIGLIDAHQYRINDFEKLHVDYLLIQNHLAFVKLQSYLKNHQINWEEISKKIVWFNLENQNDLYLAVKSGALMIGGPLIQKDQFMNNLDKKSKMYIYELLKNWGK